MNEPSQSELRPVLPGVFRIPEDGGPPQLLGGRCADCDGSYFPRPSYCRHCLGPVDEIALESGGEVYSYTIVRTRPPLGLPRPYAVGYVDLAESGLRVFGLFDPEAMGRLEIGVRVDLAVGPLGNDGQGEPCLRPYFTPLIEPVDEVG